MHFFNSASIGLVLLPLYFLATIGIGWLTRGKSKSVSSYLGASQSLPLWIVVAAYLAANSGALDIVGLCAMAAQYGVPAFHFYWIGAIPAMIFLAIWMMPVYRRSHVISVPHYLAMRYGQPMRLVNACFTAAVMLLLAGISLYAMAQVLGSISGLTYEVSITLCASVVLVYVLLGGIRATIYNEVFQLFVILAGLAPLAFRSGVILLHHSDRLEGPYAHLWTTLPVSSPSSPLDGVGVVFGLGFILSFSYWCTDFVLMQRAFSARSVRAAQSVPLWAGFGKLIFAMIVVVPGLVAHRLLTHIGATQRFDQALPLIMKQLYGPFLLSLGLTALTASLMSGLAANMSAFAALWTEDIYRVWLRPGKSDQHYLRVGRWSIVFAALAGLGCSYVNFLFKDLMENVQLIFSIFGAPFWAVFLVGMVSRRVRLRGAIAGFSAGTVTAAAHLVAYTSGRIHYGSTMSSDFHSAIYAFCIAFCVALIWGRGAPVEIVEAKLVVDWRTGWAHRDGRLWALAGLLAGGCIVLNYLLR